MLLYKIDVMFTEHKISAHISFIVLINTFICIHNVIFLNLNCLYHSNGCL
jgi:hypothetical protein